MLYILFRVDYVLMASRYAHAKQFKRMKKMNNKLKSRLGRVKQDIERQLPNYSVDIQSLFEVALKQAQKLLEQEQHSKNKLYSLHGVLVKAKLISLMNLVLKPVSRQPIRKALLLVLKAVRAILMMDTLYCHNWNR